ncbi:MULTISPECIES: trehalose-6-phosphate synthase [unclassified Roseitalea]|uniref:alpha,alpha-trehalose-phosphate synthase (UDP-forming) n=1 Tax=unclassified Roseitalea TaxID=2639107 RepID=UPI002740146D|nr:MULTISPECIES: trehalose-6-phosphate synthase [unclassified Roseitalea]
MGKLIIVSNRAPALDSANDAGGLVVALKGAMRGSGGLWVGASPEIAETPRDALAFGHREDFDIGWFDLTESDHRDYYLGYANSVLWPVFHGRVDLMEVKPGYAEAYVRVAKRIARLLAPHIEPDDLVWVHDYQVIPVAEELRKLGLTNTMGFFLHIPVPDMQAFAAIPEYMDIGRWLAAYDLLGLQTQRDVANMIDVFRHAMRGEWLPRGDMQVGGRQVRLMSFPISIDVDEFQATAERSAAQMDSPAQYRIIGVDRLDYSKGLPQRFRGYQTFLDRYPHHRGTVSLLQIAPPSREGVAAYRAIRDELERMAGHINGEFGRIDWVPIHYIHRQVPRAELAGLYRHSHICLVTSLVDGMNLVAKEFIAAQNHDDPGVLILSRFAGAFEEMKEALIINPHDPEEIADALDTALSMDRAERRRRHGALYDRIAANCVERWSERYLQELSAIQAGSQREPELDLPSPAVAGAGNAIV